MCTDLFYEERMTVFIISIIEGKSFAPMLFTLSASSLVFVWIKLKQKGVKDVQKLKCALLCVL